jgi:nucleotidyltransferase/DNA polymerase involved in DNA repair
VRVIGHLDADCFYVSAERVRDYYLRGKPVGVLGNQGACVIAKSYEMKACGVKTGEPIWEARVKCPEGIYVKRDFRWYEVLSRKMLDVVRELSPRVEYYSVDEFFFEALPGRGGWQETAEALRDVIWRRVGVPVTVGLARSKALAKLVSDTGKPFGAVALLDPAAEKELLARLPVTEICGIAGRRAARLAPYGITTCLDYARADRLLIRKLLTRVGEALWYELNGEPVTSLHTSRPPHKMIARGGSLGEATADPLRIRGWVARNLERLVEELEHYQVRAGVLNVCLCHRDGPATGARVPLTGATDRFDLLLDAAYLGVRRAWRGTAIDRMHLVASKLEWPGYYQPSLFDPPADRAAQVAALKRRVNARHGRFALRSGATLPLKEIYRDEAQGYDICDIRGKLCF